jgi:Flp pilus assembly protein TadB
MVCAVLCVGHQSGGLRARLVDDLAIGLRQHHDARREGAALAAQAQASAAVMVVAPLAFGLVLAATDAAARQFLLDTPLGALCVAAGLVLDLLAAVVMARAVLGSEDRLG